MAMACFGLVTFLPLRPDFSLPRFISCISLSTFLPADGEYLRPENFFELDFLELDFFADDPRVLFFALPPRVERLELLRDLLELLREERLLPLRERLEPPRLELLLDFFLAAFLVAITILLGGQMAGSLGRVACIRPRKVASQRATGGCGVIQHGEFQGCARVDQR